MYKSFDIKCQLQSIIDKLFRLHQEKGIINNFKRAKIKKNLCYQKLFIMESIQMSIMSQRFSNFSPFWSMRLCFCNIKFKSEFQKKYFKVMKIDFLSYFRLSSNTKT